MTLSSSETRTDRQVDVRTPAGETSGSVTLPGELFDANANVSLMHQVVIAQLAAARQGTHATKTRAMVSGGGVKPYRQKGTGRARQGSIRAPQFTGGGIVHGPQPRDYSQKTPKKMKAAALRGALSDRAREGRVHVVSAFVDGDAPKTTPPPVNCGARVEPCRARPVPFWRYGLRPPPRTSPRPKVSWEPWRAAACWATTTWWISGMLTWTSKISAGSSTPPDVPPSGVRTSVRGPCGIANAASDLVGWSFMPSHPRSRCSRAWRRCGR